VLRIRKKKVSDPDWSKFLIRIWIRNLDLDSNPPRLLPGWQEEEEEENNNFWHRIQFRVGCLSTGFSRPKIAKKNSVADPDPDLKHLLRVPIDCSSEFK
jgi:hypothetical protein